MEEILLEDNNIIDGWQADTVVYDDQVQDQVKEDSVQYQVEEDPVQDLVENPVQDQVEEDPVQDQVEEDPVQDQVVIDNTEVVELLKSIDGKIENDRSVSVDVVPDIINTPINEYNISESIMLMIFLCLFGNLAEFSSSALAKVSGFNLTGSVYGRIDWIFVMVWASSVVIKCTLFLWCSTMALSYVFGIKSKAGYSVLFGVTGIAFVWRNDLCRNNKIALLHIYAQPEHYCPVCNFAFSIACSYPCHKKSNDYHKNDFCIFFDRGF